MLETQFDRIIAGKKTLTSAMRAPLGHVAEPSPDARELLRELVVAIEDLRARLSAALGSAARLSRFGAMASSP